jgi:5-methylthioadenosine/S-adenosylhomocysteine deaminase
MNEIAEKVYETVGVRANLCSTINELGTHKKKANELYTFDVNVGEEKLRDAIDLIRNWHEKAKGRITCHFGPQAADMMSREMLMHIKELSEEMGLHIHIHVAQGGRERSQMIKRYGKSTVAYLKELGYLDENLVAVHCHDATDDELKWMAKSKVRMVGCPGSIALIDGVAPPLHAYVNAGGTAGLGSDQCPPAGHNMLAQMRYAAIVNKIKHTDPTVLPAWMLFRMATIEAAKCHRLDHLIGSIEVGKRGDVILVQLNRPNLTPIVSKPLRNLIPNLVYHATGDEITTAIIDGKIVMENRKVQTMDERTVLNEAQEAADKLTNLGKRDFMEANSMLSRMMRDGLL